MLRHGLFIVFLMCQLVLVSSHARAPATPGVRSLSAMVPARGAVMEFTLWYPASPGGAPETVGASPVFQGTPARRDAPIARGVFPVVLLAHGGLRAAQNTGAWLAADLALRGHLVLQAHAPGIGPQGAQAAARELWLRPADLSAALSAIGQDRALAPHIAAGKVGVVGFLRGGTSALALAGARIDADRYLQSCDAQNAGPDCRWFRQAGLDLRSLDATLVGRDHRDPRVQVAVAVDPELSPLFTAASLAAIRIPVDILNLGQAHTTLPGLDASGPARLIPAARYTRLAPASSFSAFNLCTAQAGALLRAEGDDDAICEDGGSRARQQIHRQIADAIAAALKRRFRALP